jgi:hypothetical protein
MQKIYTLRALTLAILVLFASPSAAESKKGIPGSKSGNYAQQYEQSILQGIRLSDVFEFNDLMTTDFGPAYANIWIGPANFLACSPPQGREFSYALCYYSGPNDPTGTSIDNPPLPCTLSPDGKLANCKCYKLSTNVVPPQISYKVDIHSILNLQIYNETVDACRSDGTRCTSSNGIIAPVCEAINTDQLIPGADLVSVYSPVKKADYSSGATSCDGIYAGCMTAPCIDSGETDIDGNPLVDCSCPLFEGPFEIGQGENVQCDIGPDNVWSAAHNPITRLPIDPAPPAGCFPDAPPNSGCPLFPDGTGASVDPDGAACKAVCEAYKEPFQDGIQLGYSCDSTLCTTLGIGQTLPLAATGGERFGLMEQACSGIQDLEGLKLIGIVEALAGCSCCASQICGCSETDINAQTNNEIFNLNLDQKAVGIVPQCDINGTLCGAP